MKSLMHPVAGLALLLPIAVNAATLGGYPPEETCRADRESSFNSGYSQGYSAGEANGFQLGHQAGHDYGIRTCVAEPLQFGVTLASVIPAASYGETEPNDNFISADPLVRGVNFWGQLYGLADQDWFYTETTAPNQNILVTFSVPYWIDGVNLLAGLPAVWNISVRDAAGNILANYNTNVMGAIDSYDKDRETYYSMTYSVTAGLTGTYYIVVKPADGTLTTVPATNATIYPYSVAVVVQDSPLPGQQPIVGFYDTEVEPNDVPSRANPLANGVTMYGLINLTFQNVDTQEDEWAQGEDDDWYVYKSQGNEIVTLSFCAKEKCGAGNWFFEVYDQNEVEKWPNAKPLLAFNTDNSVSVPETFRIGLKDPGYYFARVNHKRLFTTKCVGYQFVDIELGFTGDRCSCEVVDGAKDISAAGNFCYVPTDMCSRPGNNLLCKKSTDSCVYGVDPGCLYNTNDPPGCVTTAPQEDQKLCNTYQTLARCGCAVYSGEIEIDKTKAYTGPYNFTWHGTQLPPSTIDTDAYEDFLNRPNPYTP
ncbi:hypothetical protein [Allochromatium tepidum]|uniref:Uncharacterized protein n=1 Tax=Allochromatium tepidum TaxID=553982 RepID=A0ABM7QPF8_9GAMM|nr:hypothetical protein [Allochromatium tepidum]BCU07747.1 hypothetical protein Atep_24240 [Allochromatium tepidum]